ncbi:MAG: hypothetical protein Q8O72_17010 [Bacteroidales bacterium]|nr:hypothetical protein [Bacteroidales bacterium]
MESIYAYLFIGLVLALSLITYRYKRIKVRTYLLSEQQYPRLVLSLHIEKHMGKISANILRVKVLEDMTIEHISLELINKKRELNYYNLVNLKLVTGIPTDLKSKNEFDYRIEYSQLTELLENGELPFRTFRYVVTDQIGRKYKTHELGLNKKWQLLRPDSGNYN